MIISQNFRGSYFWQDILVFGRFKQLSVAFHQNIRNGNFEKKLVSAHILFLILLWFVLEIRHICIVSVSQNFRRSYFWKDILDFGCFKQLSVAFHQNIRNGNFEKKLVSAHILFLILLWFVLEIRHICIVSVSQNFRRSYFWKDILDFGCFKQLSVAFHQNISRQYFWEKKLKLGVCTYTLFNTPMVFTKNSPYLARDYEPKLQKLLFLTRYSCF